MERVCPALRHVCPSDDPSEKTGIRRPVRRFRPGALRHAGAVGTGLFHPGFPGQTPVHRKTAPADPPVVIAHNVRNKLGEELFSCPQKMIYGKAVLGGADFAGAFPYPQIMIYGKARGVR